MYRKKYAKKTRRSNKKRNYRKRQAKMYSKPDGHHNAKIVQRLALTVNNNGSLNNAANYSVAWQLPEADMQPATLFQNGVNCAFDWHTSTNSTSVEWVKLNNLFT